MPPTRRAALTIASLALCLAAAPAGAELLPPQTSHVRAETAEGRALVAELVSRSPTGRALVEELDRSDVTVYVRYRIFATRTNDGRIAFVDGAARGRRVFIIEVACGRLRASNLVTLAHELQHAAEIARAPSVVDPPSLAAHYAVIGYTVGASSFETDAARRTAVRVSRELSQPARTTDDRP